MPARITRTIADHPGLSPEQRDYILRRIPPDPVKPGFFSRIPMMAALAWIVSFVLWGHAIVPAMVPLWAANAAGFTSVFLIFPLAFLALIEVFFMLCMATFSSSRDSMKDGLEHLESAATMMIIVFGKRRAWSLSRMISILSWISLALALAAVSWFVSPFLLILSWVSCLVLEPIAREIILSVVGDLDPLEIAVMEQIRDRKSLKERR